MYLYGSFGISGPISFPIACRGVGTAPTNAGKTESVRNSKWIVPMQSDAWAPTNAIETKLLWVPPSPFRSNERQFVIKFCHFDNFLRRSSLCARRNNSPPDVPIPPRPCTRNRSFGDAYVPTHGRHARVVPTIVFIRFIRNFCSDFVFYRVSGHGHLKNKGKARHGYSF